MGMSMYLWNSQGSWKVTLRMTGSEGDPLKGESLTQLWNVTQVWFTSRTSSWNIFEDYDGGLRRGFESRLDISTRVSPPFHSYLPFGLVLDHMI